MTLRHDGNSGMSASGRISHDLHVVVLICKVRHAPRQHLMVKMESIAYLCGWPNSGRAPSSVATAREEVILAFVLLSGGLLLKAHYSLG